MLISHSSLLLFVTGAAILLVIPGPAVTYIVSRSIGHGRAAGLVSVLGIVTGTLCHVVAAALGISALLASSAVAFQFVKYLGAAYLIYLGIKTLRRNDQQLVEADTGETKLLAPMLRACWSICSIPRRPSFFWLSSHNLWIQRADTLRCKSCNWESCLR
jgi:threonine/homoserine/homoserine lactone efflux protein